MWCLTKNKFDKSEQAKMHLGKQLILRMTLRSQEKGSSGKNSDTKSLRKGKNTWTRVLKNEAICYDFGDKRAA